MMNPIKVGLQATYYPAQSVPQYQMVRDEIEAWPKDFWGIALTKAAPARALLRLNNVVQEDINRLQNEQAMQKQEIALLKAQLAQMQQPFRFNRVG